MFVPLNHLETDEKRQRKEENGVRFGKKNHKRYIYIKYFIYLYCIYVCLSF